MASSVYPKGKENFLKGAINMLTDTIKVALVDTGVYSFNTTHEFFSSVQSAVVGTPQTLANKTVTGGVFDADNVSFPAVTGNTVEALVIYKDTGTPATSQLILYVDDATGLPVTPNGGDLNIAWSDAAGKVFAI